MITFNAPKASALVESRGMKVGELAKRTGVSVRTLHYYDEIGLLQPSRFTESKHRVYGCQELSRLQQIKSLRELGFSLDEIRSCLGTPDFSPSKVLSLHVGRLKAQIQQQTHLVALLEMLGASFLAGETTRADDFIAAIEAMTMLDNTFAPNELQEIRDRGQKLGAEHIREVEAEWPKLIGQVRAAMLQGTDPANERVRPLALRWQHLVREFTGGNASIEQKLRARYVAEPALMARSGLDPEIFAYVNRAIRAL
jgi:MerR family transcriptional regulator, thiopeptide resistance regulator